MLVSQAVSMMASWVKTEYASDGLGHPSQRARTQMIVTGNRIINRTTFPNKEDDSHWKPGTVRKEPGSHRCVILPCLISDNSR